MEINIRVFCFSPVLLTDLPSQFLMNRYLGLSMPHPIYRTCGSSPWEVEKGTTQARLLSGQSRLEALTCIGAQRTPIK
jgi:hypothetical protein